MIKNSNRKFDQDSRTLEKNGLRKDRRGVVNTKGVKGTVNSKKRSSKGKVNSRKKAGFGDPEFEIRRNTKFDSWVQSVNPISEDDDEHQKTPEEGKNPKLI